jgi:hypothetical protein
METRADEVATARAGSARSIGDGHSNADPDPDPAKAVLLKGLSDTVAGAIETARKGKGCRGA